MGLLLKIVVTIFLLYTIFTKINIGTVIAVGSTVDMRLVTLSLALIFIAWTIAAAKWYLLLPARVAVPFWRMFTYTLIGATYTILLPGGQIFGEVGKYAHIVKKNASNKKILMLSIMLDKALGLCGLIFIGFLALLSQQSVPAVFFKIYALLSTLAILFIVTLLIMSQLGEKLRIAIVQAIPMLLSLTLSLVYQFCIGIIMWILSRAIGIDLSFSSLLWISTAVGLLTALPITYGGLGIREISLVSLLSLYSIPDVQSVTLSLMIYMLLAIGSLPGLFLIFRDFVKMRAGSPQTNE